MVLTPCHASLSTPPGQTALWGCVSLEASQCRTATSQCKLCQFSCPVPIPILSPKKSKFIFLVCRLQTIFLGSLHLPSSLSQSHHWYRKAQAGVFVCRFQTTFLGSRAVAGTFLQHRLLEATDAAGISLGQLLQPQGSGDPEADVSKLAKKPQSVRGCEHFEPWSCWPDRPGWLRERPLGTARMPASTDLYSSLYDSFMLCLTSPPSQLAATLCCPAVTGQY